MSKHSFLHDHMPCPESIPQEVWDSHGNAFKHDSEVPFAERWAKHMDVYNSYARDADGNFIMEDGQWKRVFN